VRPDRPDDAEYAGSGPNLSSVKQGVDTEGSVASRLALFDVDDGMPPWIGRLLRQLVVLTLAVIAGVIVLRELRGLIVLLVISQFLAIALEPAVAFLARRGWRRGIATGAIFAVVFAGTVLFVGSMTPLIVDQTATFIGNIPGYTQQVQDLLVEIDLTFDVDQLSAEVTASLQSWATNLAGGVLGASSAVLRTIFDGFTVALFTFYLTADGPRVRRAVLSLLPQERQREVLAVLDIAIDRTGGYFYSRLLLASISTLLGWAVFQFVLDLPFALPLALWLGVVSQFIPVVGTYIGGILPFLIGLLEDLTTGLLVVVYIVIYQIVENYVLAPRITAKTMALHPAVAFGAALVGGTLMGAMGAIMALPVAATLQAFISTYLRRHDLVDSFHFEESAIRAKNSTQQHDE
jgi:predicted PurR-regulated permease PerM